MKFVPAQVPAAATHCTSLEMPLPTDQFSALLGQHRRTTLAKVTVDGNRFVYGSFLRLETIQSLVPDEAAADELGTAIFWIGRATQIRRRQLPKLLSVVV